MVIFSKCNKLYQRICYRWTILCDKFRNRIPDKAKVFFRQIIVPYLSIVIVTGFVFLSNYVQAAEANAEPVFSDRLMDLNPAEVAQTVAVVAPYTPNFEEDSVQVALAMKDQSYVGKPLITETAQTAEQVGQRKAVVSYTVESGDTLSSIGWKYGLKIATIKSYNSLSSDNIRIGQTLRLPPQDLTASRLATISTSGGTRSPFKGTFGRPTRGWHLSQYFGHTSFERWHTGIDLTSRSGTAILASASGRISAVRRGWGGGYGNHIIITHGDGFTTLYGHLSQINVSVGQWVNQGQQIGVMGSTGWSTGVHLHFEIRKNGKAQNPLSYL